MSTFYDSDISPNVIQNKRVAIVGFGAQGRSHALNLQDSGVDVVVALREGSDSMVAAISLGLDAQEINPAIQSADVVMMLSPDSTHAKIYRESIHAKKKNMAC